MTSNIKVLITSPSLDEVDNVSGVSSVVKNILIGFLPSKYPVDFLVFKAGRKDGDAKSFGWLAGQIYMLFSYVFRIIRFRPDWVHVNGPLDTLAVIRDFFFIAIARILRSKVLYHIHGGPFIHQKPPVVIFRWFIFLSLKLCNRIVVLGEIEKKKLTDIYFFCEKKIYVLPNAIDVPAFFSDKCKLGNQLRILYMGRFVSSKGIEVLIRALMELNKLGVNFKVSFFGAGPLEDLIIDSLMPALKEKFNFGGIAKGATKYSAFQDADVLVLPSLYGEGLPMVILEAMAHGVPVIATPDGSIPELIIDRINGFLVPKGDSSALLAALVYMSDIKSSEHVATVRSAAYACVNSYYSLSGYINKLFVLYT